MIEIYNIFNANHFPLPLVRHHSYKNQQYAIQGRNTPSRKCTAYSWRIQPVFVQYSLQPIISFERGSNCAEHAINLSNMCLYFYFHKGTRTQFTAESRVVFKMHDLLKKNKIQQSFQEVHFKKFQLRFHVLQKMRKCIVSSLQVCYCFSTRQRF